jgi:hypothetical protein
VRERVMNDFANSWSDKKDNMCNGVAPTIVNKEEAKKKQHVEDVVVPSPQQDAPKRSYALIVSYLHISKTSKRREKINWLE